jgi:hypothetical protein
MIHVLIPRVAHHVRYVSRPGPSQLSVMVVILYLTQFTRLAQNRECKAKVTLAAVPGDSQSFLKG